MEPKPDDLEGYTPKSRGHKLQFCRGWLYSVYRLGFRGLYNRCVRGWEGE